MEKCCNICGDIGVAEALISCSQCRSSCEHKYCMRTPHKELLHNWLCENCESSSKPMSAATSPSRYLLKDCKDEVLLANSRKLLNESRELCIDWEKKFPIGKTRGISAEVEPITVSSKAVKSLPFSEITSNSSLRQPKIEVNSSSEQDLGSGPFQQSNTQTLGAMEIAEQQQSQPEKPTGDEESEGYDQ